MKHNRHAKVFEYLLQEHFISMLLLLLLLFKNFTDRMTLNDHTQDFRTINHS